MEGQGRLIIDFDGLLKLLSTTIYSNQRVCIREMIQNSNDSCIELQDKYNSLNQCSIKIIIDSNNNIIRICDNGIGMNEKILRENLSKIGNRYKDCLKSELSYEASKKIIGTFGIGILSAFAISDKVEIHTKRYGENNAFLWSCESNSANYTILIKDKSQHGTEIILYISSNKQSLLNEEEIISIIKKYADFITIPIYFNNLKKQINEIHYPWEKQDSLHEQKSFIHRKYKVTPIVIIPLNNINDHINAIFFIPDPKEFVFERKSRVDIYASRMFVCEDNNVLMPSWARFIYGIIESHKLNPSAGRDTLIEDDTLFEIKDEIRKQILSYFYNLSLNNPNLLASIVHAHNAIFKNDSVEDKMLFSIVSDFVFFKTNKGMKCLRDCINREENTIYYSDRIVDQYSSIHDKIILLNISEWDKDFLRNYEEKKRVSVKQYENRQLSLINKVEAEWENVLENFKMVLNMSVKLADFPTGNSPIVISEINGDIDAIEGSEVVNQRSNFIANINTQNPIIERLKDISISNKELNTIIKSLFYNSFLSCNEVFDRSILNDILRYNYGIIEKYLMQILHTPEMKKQYNYRTCFFAFPFENKFHNLKNDIQKLFDKNEYGIKIVAAESQTKDLNIMNNIKRQIKESHFGIADISGNNSNVLWELGYMNGLGKPTIILRDQDNETQPPFDLYGEYHIEYKIVESHTTGRTEYSLLADSLSEFIEKMLSEYPVIKNIPKWEKSIS